MNERKDTGTGLILYLLNNYKSSIKKSATFTNTSKYSHECQNDGRMEVLLVVFSIVRTGKII